MFLTVMTFIAFGEEKACEPKNTDLDMGHGGGTFIMWKCFAAGGAGPLHKMK